MMKTGHIPVLLLLLLPLCTLIISSSVKDNHFGLYDRIIINSDSDKVKEGSCPPQRYYVKKENEICHKLCTKDSTCEENMKCCPDNCHFMCKPPAQEKPGMCPSYNSALAPAEKCDDYCSSDSECPGTWKCCTKKCGKSCTATLSDIAKPSTVSTTSSGFCLQEEMFKCALEERKFCNEESCINGYKCCPKICRYESQKALQERAGECPASTACPPESESKVCSSDYDCSTYFKCCATCGNLSRCVKAVNIPSFLHNGTSTIFVSGGRR